MCSQVSAEFNGNQWYTSCFYRSEVALLMGVLTNPEKFQRTIYEKGSCYWFFRLDWF